MLNPMEREAFEHGYKIIVTMAEGMANEAMKDGRGDMAAFMMGYVDRARAALPEFVDMADEAGMAVVLWDVERACGVKHGNE